MIKLKVWALALAFSLVAMGAQAQTEVEKDVENFRTWMKSKASQADSVTRAEWPTIKDSFRSKTTTLDHKSNAMSPATKEEYSELKLQYKAMEARHEEQYGQPLKRDVAAKWEKELAGRNNLKSIKPSEMRDVFTYFQEGVRGQRANWSLRDWEYAEHVYLELSNRKQAILDRLSNGDKIKIAALQVEFNTLRKSRDAKDKYNEMREKR